MLTIWKYPIKMSDHTELDMPKGGVPLTVQVQHEEPQLWVLVDTEEPLERRLFRLAGTGHPLESGLCYIGTFQYGAFVFHLFETRRRYEQKKE